MNLLSDLLKHAIFGNTIYFNHYTLDYEKDYTSLPGIRMHNHIKEFSVMRDMLLDGIKTFETIQNPSDELQKLINIGWFMYRTTLTVLTKFSFFFIKYISTSPIRIKMRYARIIQR